MGERLEHFGHPCTLPEPNTVGQCGACGGDIYDYEHVICECEAEIHKSCQVECAQCGHSGCKACMLHDADEGEWFCDTSGPGEYLLPKEQRLLNSECREEWLK